MTKDPPLTSTHLKALLGAVFSLSAEAAVARHRLMPAI
jgi:hypothetical protein